MGFLTRNDNQRDRLRQVIWRRAADYHALHRRVQRGIAFLVACRIKAPGTQYFSRLSDPQFHREPIAPGYSFRVPAEHLLERALNATKIGLFKILRVRRRTRHAVCGIWTYQNGPGIEATGGQARADQQGFEGLLWSHVTNNPE